MQQFFIGHVIVHNRLAEEETAKDYMVLKVFSKILLSYSRQVHKKIWATDLCKCVNTPHASKNFTCTPKFKSFFLNGNEFFLFVIISVQ